MTKATLAMLYPLATTGGVHGMTVTCLTHTLLTDPGDVFGGSVIIEGSGVQLDLARNRVVTRFLDEHDRDWLYFTDADQVWNSEELFDFVRRTEPDTPFMAGLVRRRTAPEDDTVRYPIWVGHDMCHSRSVPEQHTCKEWLGFKPREPFEACTAPVAATLLHRDMLLAMRKYYGGDHWFSTIGPGMSEDSVFCGRVHELNYPVMVDPRFEVGHLKVQVI